MSEENPEVIQKEDQKELAGAAEGGVTIVLFKVGKELFGTETKQVREIIRIPEMTRAPGAPSSVAGIINLRGKVISVIDLGKKLGMS